MARRFGDGRVDWVAAGVLMELDSILWGALLGLVSSYPGEKILYSQLYRIAAQEGRSTSMPRHFPYLRHVQILSVPLGALLSWGTGIVWSSLLAGPAAGVLLALPATIAHMFYRGADHRLCADHDLPIAEAVEREFERSKRARAAEAQYTSLSGSTDPSSRS